MSTRTPWLYPPVFPVTLDSGIAALAGGKHGLNLRGALYTVATILTLMTSASAYADVTVSANCSAVIRDPWQRYPGIGVNIDDCTRIDSSLLTGTVSDSARVDVLPPTDIFSVVASAEYAARGDYGNLGVMAYSWAGNPSTSPYLLTSSANTEVRVTSNDTITVTSDLLAQGSYVTINLSGYLEGTAFGHKILDPRTSQAETISRIASTVQVHEKYNGSSGTNAVFTGCFGFMFSGCEGSFFQPYSIVMDVRVGSTLSIGADLYASSSSATTDYVGFQAIEAQSEASAMNSLTTYLTPTTAGVRLIAQSGHDYAAPVPEPAAWGLMLSGLALVGVAARRRKQAEV